MSTTALPLDTFVALSSALTGIAAEQLKPAIDPIGIAEQYLATLIENVDAATLAQLDDAFDADAPTDSAAAILADPTLGNLARSIIKLWLLGSWYDPATPDRAVNVVSAQAYKEGYVWRIMQSHPMGYSMFPYGYWNDQPPKFSDFITLAQPSTTGGASHV